MANSLVSYIGDGSTTTFSVPFPYIAQSNVTVYVSGVAQTVTWPTSASVHLASAPASGAFVTIKRATPSTTPIVTFTDASTLTASDLNTFQLQALYVAQEAQDAVTSGLALNVTTAQYDAGGKQIKNVATATDSGDAVTLGSVNGLVNTAISTYNFTVASNAAAAAASASSASSSASSASSSASAAATSAATAAATVSSAPLSWRNKIINGDMSIFQRGNYFGGGIGVALITQDRWFASVSGAAVLFSVAGSINNIPTSMGIAGAAGNTGVNIAQHIERANSFALTSSTVTFSGYVYSTVAISSVGITHAYPAAADKWSSPSYVSGGSFALAANTWTRFSVTFTAGANAIYGMQIELDFGALGAGSNTYVSGLQLELGSVATPFEMLPYDVQLARCQRYYNVINTSGYLVSYNATSAANAAYVNLTIPPMRTTPTLTGTLNITGSLNIASQSAIVVGPSGIILKAVTTAAGNTYGTFSGTLSLNAEL